MRSSRRLPLPGASYGQREQGRCHDRPLHGAPEKLSRIGRMREPDVGTAARIIGEKPSHRIPYRPYLADRRRRRFDATARLPPSPGDGTSPAWNRAADA
jgi:hypothetical protein